MNLNVNYLGHNLKSPLILASSGLSDDINKIVKAEKNGIGAVVLKSIFEEQILANVNHLNYNEEYKNSLEYVKNLSENKILDAYINFIKDCKNNSNIPIIGSIHCISDKIWYQFIPKLEEVGIDALEININIPPLHQYKDYNELYDFYLQIISKVTNVSSVPISVKLNPFLPNYNKLIKDLEEIRISSIVLFNKPYSPSINIDNLSIDLEPELSNKVENKNSIRWLVLLYNQTNLQLSAATGFFDYDDVVRAILAGATTIQLCSTIYLNGYNKIEEINNHLMNWMKEHNFYSIDEFKGLISKKLEFNSDFERIQYMMRDNN